MKKTFLTALYTLYVLAFPIYAQEQTSCRYDTLQIEQQWKQHLTDKADTSYLKVCIPNNDVIPMYDCNYDGFVIFCDDGAIIRLNTTPTIPSSIEQNLESFDEETIAKCFGNSFLGALQKEYYNTTILGMSKDSSLQYPQSITLEGIDKKGLYWKLKRIEYICISYENVVPGKKNTYDFILNEYRFLTNEEVVGYRYLPLYK
ncbi:MAG: hypothetical protein J6X51_02600 [Bacteroidales bacterium]|nr:hypothetical protein [Bacteroidales bacterium]